MKNPNKFEPFIMTVLLWLNTVFIQSSHLSHTIGLLNKFFLILRTRGKKDAIRFCKESRAFILTFLSNISDLSKASREKASRGLPKYLRFLGHVKTLSYPDIRLVLTSLYVSRNMSLPVNPNVDTIESPPKKAYPAIGKHVKDFWGYLGYRVEKHGYKVPRNLFWSKYHFTTKTGPNGHAVWSSLADLSAITPSLYESLVYLGGKKIQERMQFCAAFINIKEQLGIKTIPTSGRYLRKLVAIPSQEGKTREVAILDYWSQTVLFGLHQYLFNVLRKIPQDCTFNQGSFKDKLIWDYSEPFISVDLTAATDRFPIILIEEVLMGRFTTQFVKHWRNVMVGLPFWSPELKREISYAVGNPMGAYSSWNSFALAHHYVMYYCCRELGINFKNARYVILGDDIVINDRILAKKYLSIISDLGIEYSKSKTHHSNHMFEFAKRIFHNGEEVTPFPISALWQARKTSAMMLNVVASEERKGWRCLEGTPVALQSLYKRLCYSTTYVRELGKLFDIAYHVMVSMDKRDIAAVHSALGRYYPKYQKMDDWTMESLFARSIIDTFHKTLPQGYDSLTIGHKASILMGRLQGVMQQEHVKKFLISIPFCSLNKQIENKYREIIEGGGVEALMCGDWKQTLRSLTLPLTDEIYYCRNQDVKVTAAFSLAITLRGYALKPIKGRSFAKVLTWLTVPNLYTGDKGGDDMVMA